MKDFGNQASVRFENVEKSFGDVKVLRDFDLEVAPGEFVVLLGASGSGKTTALRILSGLETPSGGNVYIDDENVTEVLPKYRDISMVFQSYALYPHKTVAENIGFPLKVRGMDRLGWKRQLWMPPSRFRSKTCWSAFRASCLAVNAKGSPSPARSSGGHRCF